MCIQEMTMDIGKKVKKKKKRKKQIYFVLGLILLLSILNINAEESGGTLTGKLNSVIKLPQECASCTYVKLTTITYPDLTQLSIQTNMVQDGTSYSYNFNKTNQTGKYVYCMLGDVDGTDTSVCKDFYITPSGRNDNSNIVFIIFIIIIIYAIAFIGFFLKNEIVALLGGMFMIGLSIYLIQNGIIIYRDWITNYFAYFTLGIGAFFAILASMSLYEDL